MSEILNDSTFLLVAMHHYDNPQCFSLQEFEEDLKRFGYLRKLFARYRETSELRERLILNHIIVLYNLFGIMATDFLFLKIGKEYWNELATFLLFLERMPDHIPDLGVDIHAITFDDNILKILRQI